MWVRIDDDLIDHSKVLRAGERLGRYGVARVLATFMEGLTYSARKLTDGALPVFVVRQFKVDPRPLDVAAVLAADDVRLWEPTEDGYQVHNYHNYNPTAADVKAKRARDRERKRSGIREESKGNPKGIRGARARVSQSPPQSQKRDTTAASLTARDVPGNANENYRVISRLVRTVFDEDPAWLDAPDLTDEIKTRCARLPLDYDATTVARAIASESTKWRRMK